MNREENERHRKKTRIIMEETLGDNEKRERTNLITIIIRINMEDIICKQLTREDNERTMRSKDENMRSRRKSGKSEMKNGRTWEIRDDNGDNMGDNMGGQCEIIGRSRRTFEKS